MPAPIPPFAGILPCTVPWGISPGEGLGEGTPSPAKRTMLALPQGSRAGAGVLVARALRGAQAGEGDPDFAFHRHLAAVVGAGTGPMR